LIKEYREAEATDRIVIDLQPSGRPGGSRPPILCGLELIEEG